MKVPVFLVCSAFALQGARGEVLSDADRATLLENLDKLKESAESKLDARFRIAIGAYRNAIGSDTAAMELYLNCVEKVNFEKQQKSSNDFREWKRKEAEKLADPGLRLALRHQLRWLMLTLQATSQNADRAKLAGDAQEIVDAIFRDPEKLGGQEQILGQAVTSSVFAQAYDIGGVMVEKWALSPVQLDQVYTEILLPPFQRPGYLAGLRATWIKRIQQEGAKAEFWHEKPRDNRKDDKKEEKRIGMADAMRPQEYETFLQETAPKLQWDMEVDLFKNGDQNGAAARMLAHLEKYIAHPSAREWGEQLRELLKPQVVPIPAAAVH